MRAEIHTARDLLPTARYGLLRRAWGKAAHWHYKNFVEKKHRACVLEKIAGLPFVVLPGVLNPRLMRSGEFFATQLNANLIHIHTDVLDMGTGSGICAIFAGKYARHVVAIDINPAAVRCAQINTLLNNAAKNVEVLQGDLFTPVQGRRFDVILFNPPFLQGVPNSDADRAWRSTDVAERFATRLGDHLTSRGYALVLLSTYGGAPTFIDHFRRSGFSITPIAERQFINEKFVILKLIPDSHFDNNSRVVNG